METAAEMMMRIDSKGKGGRGQEQIVSQPGKSAPEALLASASLIFFLTLWLLDSIALSSKDVKVYQHCLLSGPEDLPVHYKSLLCWLFLCQDQRENSRNSGPKLCSQKHRTMFT